MVQLNKLIIWNIIIFGIIIIKTKKEKYSDEENSDKNGNDNKSEDDTKKISEKNVKIKLIKNLINIEHKKYSDNEDDYIMNSEVSDDNKFIPKKKLIKRINIDKTLTQPKKINKDKKSSKDTYHIKDKYYRIEIENLEYKAILIIIYKHEEGKDKKCFEATSNLFSAFYDKLRIKKNIITVIEYTNPDYKILKDLIQSHKSDVKKTEHNEELSEHNISREDNPSLNEKQIKNTDSTNDVFESIVNIVAKRLKIK